MIRALIVLSVLLVSAEISPSTRKIAPDAVQSAQANGSDRVIVALRQPHTKADAEEIHQLQDEVLASLPTGSFELSDRWRHVPAFAGTMHAEAIAALESDPRVERVDLDADGKGALLVSVPLIRADVAHTKGYTGSGVTIAILDSGIDETHPDLQGALVDEACFCRNSDGSGCCPGGATQQLGPGAAADDHGHGSNVAGIVASRGSVAGVGVAPGAKLVIVKVLDRNEAFSGTSQVLSALDWIIENHPEVHVINMSLGTNAIFAGYCDSAAAFTIALASAINTLRRNGASTFVASGNDRSTTSMEAPACVQGAISVGAVWKADVGAQNLTFFNCTDATTMADQVTCFSNSNSTLDLLAPGAPIISDWLRGGRSIFWGTSQASAHCAGAAALLLQIDPLLTVDEVEQTLKNTGKPVTDPRNGVMAPRIDVAAAVAAVPRPSRRRAAHH